MQSSLPWSSFEVYLEFNRTFRWRKANLHCADFALFKVRYVKFCIVWELTLFDFVDLKKKKETASMNLFIIVLTILLWVSSYYLFNLKLYLPTVLQY